MVDMMNIVQCWIERPARGLDRPFTYYYDGSISAGVRVTVGFGPQKLTGFVERAETVAETKEEAEERLGMKLRPVLSVLDSEPLITPELHELALYMRDTTLSPMISCLTAMLPAKLKPASKAGKAVTERWVSVADDGVKLTAKQEEAVETVRKAGSVRYSEMRKRYPSILPKLVEKGVLCVSEREREAVLKRGGSESKRSLTPLQKKAFDEITSSGDSVFLMRGVTGSGKTEVYFHLAEKALSEGKQVLILVPEISLTPQMIERVSRRFDSDLAIYHSGLNEQEKYEQYRLVYSGRARIVVGTRSAVFLPFQKLGLIVMDEEHDGSYKQENQPAYHCRDIALFRGKYHGCKVILGSATPALESYARAVKNVYHLITLPERVNGTPPRITVADMKESMRRGGSAIISDVLEEKISERLAAHEQVILLLNRRGYHALIRCRSCETVYRCPHCDISMSWHRDENMMKCHTCGTVLPVPAVCPECGSAKGFSAYGYGTQRLETELNRLFPEAKLLRMDADTTTRKDSHRTILEAFGRREADILVGTQMIAKGLDYPNVSLVGILNADEGVDRTDFRSCETAFDLLMQASGRSGRADIPGDVVIQAFEPDHYAVACAAAQDYDGFFVREMSFRHDGMYPPYTYLIALTVSSLKQEEAERGALSIKNGVNGNYRTIGVLPLLKINDRYRCRILLKGKDPDEMRRDIRRFLETEEGKRIRDLRIDVNPQVLD